MRKLALLAAGTGLLALGAVVLFEGSSTAQQAPAQPPRPWVLSVEDSAGLKGPKQPIFFRHDIHVGVNKTPCQYCHYSVAEASEPGIPSMATRSSSSSSRICIGLPQSALAIMSLSS